MLLSIGAILGSILATSISDAQGQTTNYSPSDIVEYLRLKGHRFSDPPTVDSGFGYPRAFFTLENELFVEIVALPSPDSEFEERNTGTYRKIIGENFFAHWPEYGKYSPRPTHEDRVAFIRNRLLRLRNFNLVALIDTWDVRPTEQPRAENRVREFRRDFMSYTPDELARLRKVPRVRELFVDGVTDPVEALTLLSSIGARDLVRSGLYDEDVQAGLRRFLHQIMEWKTAVEEKRREISDAEAEPRDPFEADLVCSDTDKLTFRVSIRNRLDTAVTASLFLGFLDADGGNVHFLIWRPGSDSPYRYTPYFVVACRTGDATTFQPGDEIVAEYDLSTQFQELGCYRVQAEIAFSQAPRTNVVTICR